MNTHHITRSSALLAGLLLAAVAFPSTAQEVEIDVPGVHVDSDGNVRIDGDDDSRVQVDGEAGGVHVIGVDGGEATTTIGTRTLRSGQPVPADGALSYVNQDLDGSDFSGRRLVAVAFVNSELRGADFRDAILTGANFANADLGDADFRSANLRNAQLANADLAGARFDGATWVDGRVCGEGSVGGCR